MFYFVYEITNSVAEENNWKILLKRKSEYHWNPAFHISFSKELSETSSAKNPLKNPKQRVMDKAEDADFTQYVNSSLWKDIQLK